MADPRGEAVGKPLSRRDQSPPRSKQHGAPRPPNVTSGPKSEVPRTRARLVVAALQPLLPT
jgi:hypothetical protein